MTSFGDDQKPQRARLRYRKVRHISNGPSFPTMDSCGTTANTIEEAQGGVMWYTFCRWWSKMSKVAVPGPRKVAALPGSQLDEDTAPAQTCAADIGTRTSLGKKTLEGCTEHWA